jgi:hypothetical protein
MINLNELVQEDIGRWVIYNRFRKKETGRIKSWNNLFIFVVYSCDNKWEDFKNYTGCGTKPEDLEFMIK